MTSSFGNVISRLQGLKNVSGRRVMPGQEFLQQFEEPELDVQGTATEPLPYQKRTSLAEPNLGQPTPQSYDVRANMSSSAEPQEGVWSKIGNFLGNAFKGYKPEYPKVSSYDEFVNQVQEVPRAQEEPVTAYEPNIIDKVGRHIKQALPEPVERKAKILTANGIQERTLPATTNFQVAPQFAEKFPELVKNNPTVQQQIESQIQAQQEPTVSMSQLNEDIEKAMQEPWVNVAYGSAQQVANNPALQGEFEVLTGEKFNPQIQAAVSKFEEAMKGIEDRLNGINTQLDPVAEEIAQRIVANKTTEQDKYYMGLALLMPLLVGGFFGKEAGFKALAGGTAGVADVLANRQKQLRGDEEALLNIAKQQTGIAKELGQLQETKAAFEPALRKTLPELHGLPEKTYTDPVTGKQKNIVEVLPGLVTDANKVISEKDKTRIQNAAEKLANEKSFAMDINDLTSNTLDVISQLKDKPAWKKLHINSLSEIVPGSLSQLTDDVVYNGQRVSAGPLLENLIALINTKYNAQLGLGQIDAASARHFNKVFQNPTKTLLNSKDVEQNILNLRDFLQKDLIYKAKNLGFYPEFIVEEFQAPNQNVLDKLNQKENKKRLEQRKLQAIKNEVSYAE